MVFSSDRENHSNLYRYDLGKRTITQMTDLSGKTTAGSRRINACVSEINHAVTFWTENQLVAVDLDTFVERVIAEVDPSMPPSTLKSRAGPTADGKYVCAQLMEVIPQETSSVSFSYSRFREFFEKKPLTQIARIEIATGKIEIIHEDRRYMNHVNASPVLPDILTYCHEGPWNLIDIPTLRGAASGA